MSLLSFLNRSRDDRDVQIIEALLALLKKNVSRSSIRKLKEYPGYPSIKSYSDFLQDFGFRTMVVRIDFSKLASVPLPAIFHLSTGGGSFVIVSKVDGDSVHFTRSSDSHEILPVSEFEKNWSGNVLLVQTTPNAGEAGYQHLKKSESSKSTIQAITVLTGLVFLVIPIFQIRGALLSYYFLQVAGAVTSGLLFLKQTGSKSAFIDRLCKVHSKVNCDDVVNSRSSMLFGVLHLSELSFFYFVGGILYTSSQSSHNYLISYWWLLVVCVPVAILPYTVYKQWIVLRTWCPLCLVVSLIVVIQIVVVIDTPEITWGAPSWPSLLLSYFCPLLLWVNTRSIYWRSARLGDVERKLQIFLKNRSVLGNLLERQKKIEFKEIPNEPLQRAHQSGMSIIFVSSPTCKPCAAAHEIVHDLIVEYRGKINYTIRFLIDLETEGIAQVVVRHLIAINLSEGFDSMLLASKAWFNNPSDVDQWITKFPVKTEVSSTTVNQIISEQNSWARANNLSYTPLVVINNKVLPEPFTINHLRWHLNHLIHSEIDSTTS